MVSRSVDGWVDVVNLAERAGVRGVAPVALAWGEGVWTVVGSLEAIPGRSVPREERVRDTADKLPRSRIEDERGVVLAVCDDVLVCGPLTDDVRVRRDRAREREQEHHTDRIANLRITEPLLEVPAVLRTVYSAVRVRLSLVVRDVTTYEARPDAPCFLNIPRLTAPAGRLR